MSEEQTPDDTFKRLARTPLAEMRRLLNERLDRSLYGCEDINVFDEEFFRGHGWTQTECIRAINTVDPLNP